MRPPLLALSLALLAACGDRSTRGPAPHAESRDSTRAPAPMASPSPSSDHTSKQFTAVFEDEVERTPRAPAGKPAPKSPPVLSEITLTLTRQLSDRGAIQWSAARALQWSDFQAPPQPQGREAALSTTGQISGSACSGTQFQYGVYAGFIPGESWVKPEVVANPQQSAIALAHERLHFDITEIISRELRQKFATVEKPCDMTEVERDAMGAAAFEEEKKVQQRYDDETRHGLDAGAQGRWAGWAGTTLLQLQAFAAPIGAREN